MSVRPTRRGLLKAAALAPLAAGLGPKLAGAATGLEAIVVGAGAFGGWTALALARAGARVTLLDAWGPGNSRASSGGETRVIRAIYGADEIYVAWVARAFELWAELEGRTGETLYHPTGSLWMMRGDDSYVRAALPILERHGFPVEAPTHAEARRRWPQIDLAGVEKLYLERRAGVLAARDATRIVRDRLVAEGGIYRTARVRPGAIDNGRLTGLALDDGSTLGGDVYLFACGPWLGEVFPEVIGERVLPSRQQVHYFGVPAGSDLYGPRRLPVWIDFGERIVYGLPDVHGRGFKIADDTRGGAFDPTTGDRTPDPEEVAAARRFLGQRFPELAAAPLVEARVCQYENSPDGHLIVDRHPGAENLWLLGGGSGHGFKLSPALGERVAATVIGGEEPEPLFRLERLEASDRRRTQFDDS